MRGFLIGIVVTAVAFAILAYVLPQVEFDGDAVQLVVLALVFGVVNGLIKPVVRILSFPITAMTLGLFALVINGALLLLTAWFANSVLDVPFTVGGFPTDRLSLDAIAGAIIAAIVLGLITAAIGLFVKD